MSAVPDELDAGDLTPEPGRALDEASFAVTPDGAAVITTWAVPVGNGRLRWELVAIDISPGAGAARRVLAVSETHDFGGPVVVSPDGGYVACTRERHSTEDLSTAVELWVVDLGTGEGIAQARTTIADCDREPHEIMAKRDHGKGGAGRHDGTGA